MASLDSALDSNYLLSHTASNCLPSSVPTTRLILHKHDYMTLTIIYIIYLTLMNQKGQCPSTSLTYVARVNLLNLQWTRGYPILSAPAALYFS